MKNLILIITIFASVAASAQVDPAQDTVVEQKKSFGEKLGKMLGIDKEEEIKKLSFKIKSQEVAIDSLAAALEAKPPVVTKTIKIPSLSDKDSKEIMKDEKFLTGLPKSYDRLSKKDAGSLAKEIERKIGELMRQRDSLIAAKSSKELIHAKENMIGSLNREKSLIGLSEEKKELAGKNEELKSEKEGLKKIQEELKKYLKSAIAILALLILAIAVILQRKRIRVQDVEIEKQIQDINKKNTYLEYAARIIRHDMHSGINTYIPRGISSLKKRIMPDVAETLKIGAPMKMIEDGLAHTQKVYKNVYEFTNLVKVHTDFKKSQIDAKESLEKYLSGTSYSSQVSVSDLGSIEANEQLFCNALDNLIKNGLKYNKSESKKVSIYRDSEYIVVEDNGTGLSPKKFDALMKKGIEPGEESGIGLSITKAIVEEHGFSMECETSKNGTKIKIKTA